MLYKEKREFDTLRRKMVRKMWAEIMKDPYINKEVQAYGRVTAYEFFDGNNRFGDNSEVVFLNPSVKMKTIKKHYKKRFPNGFRYNKIFTIYKYPKIEFTKHWKWGEFFAK